VTNAKDGKPYTGLSTSKQTFQGDVEKVTTTVSREPSATSLPPAQKPTVLSKRKRAMKVRANKPLRQETTPATVEITVKDTLSKDEDADSHGCNRCLFFCRAKKYKVQKKASFYCDIGMRSVLRQIRTQLLTDPNLNALHNASGIPAKEQ